MYDFNAWDARGRPAISRLSNQQHDELIRSATRAQLEEVRRRTDQEIESLHTQGVIADVAIIGVILVGVLVLILL